MSQTESRVPGGKDRGSCHPQAVRVCRLLVRTVCPEAAFALFPTAGPSEGSKRTDGAERT